MYMCMCMHHMCMYYFLGDRPALEHAMSMCISPRSAPGFLALDLPVERWKAPSSTSPRVVSSDQP